MDRIDAILSHESYKSHIKKNLAAEENRIFCRHNMEHFLDVARIAMILNLEEKMGLEKVHIYAAALLHDIGRHIQYAEGIPHEAASAEAAVEILEDCGFSEAEREIILTAIRNHRNKEIAKNRDLSGVLYRADKASRACFGCTAWEVCDWAVEKKNMHLRY